jgi:tetratricopeptide (TPR) repeat protein
VLAWSCCPSSERPCGSRAEARHAGNRAVELAALIERAALLLLSDPATTDQLLEEVEAAVPALEELGDERGLASAWTLIGLRSGLWKGRFARGEEALQKALVHARHAGDRRQEATILSQLCFAAAQGPTPVPQAIERCHEILEEAQGDRLVEAGVARYLAPLEARTGHFDEARRLVAKAHETYEELGMELVGQAASAHAYGDIELLAGDYEAAERALRSSSIALERMGERGYQSTVFAYLAQALYGLGRLDEAEELAGRALESASEEDIWSQAIARGPLARVLARRGELAEAETCARVAVELVEVTDALDLHGSALLDLADVLVSAGRHEEAASAVEEAVRLFERKENEVSAERARAMIPPVARSSAVTASEDRGDPAS